jgi:hypothetical protein
VRQQKSHRLVRFCSLYQMMDGQSSSSTVKWVLYASAPLFCCHHPSSSSVNLTDCLGRPRMTSPTARYHDDTSQTPTSWYAFFHSIHAKEIEHMPYYIPACISASFAAVLDVCTARVHPACTKRSLQGIKCPE